MIPITFHELTSWPEPARLRPRVQSPFKAGYQATLDLLDREIRALKGKNVRILVDVDPRWIRNDGWLRSDAKARGPGVILAFDSKHGPLQYPCDRYTHWQENLRAIALALENLRAVDRYGVTRRGEQYSGWRGLPAPAAAAAVMTVDQAAEWLSSKSGLSPAQCFVINKNDMLNAYRAAAKKLHPDSGGDVEQFKTLQDVKAILDQHFAGQP